jgi:hypothetical protein
MKTKHLFLSVAAFIMAGNFQVFGLSVNGSETKTSVFVQPPQGTRPQRTPETRAKRESEWMKTDLALTDKQIPLVDTINLKYAKMQDALMKETKGQDRETVRPKMEELRKQKTAELKLILTEDQMKKYLELIPQHMGPRKGGSRPEGPRPENNNN